MKTGDVFWANKPGETPHIYRFVSFIPWFSIDEGYIGLYDMTTGEHITVNVFWFKERIIIND